MGDNGARAREGAELRVPLALTVAGGLLLSTLVTLVLIPVLVSFVPARAVEEAGP